MHRPGMYVQTEYLKIQWRRLYNLTSQERFYAARTFKVRSEQNPFP